MSNIPLQIRSHKANSENDLNHDHTLRSFISLLCKMHSSKIVWDTQQTANLSASTSCRAKCITMGSTNCSIMCSARHNTQFKAWCFAILIAMVRPAVLRRYSPCVALIMFPGQAPRHESKQKKSKSNWNFYNLYHVDGVYTFIEALLRIRSSAKCKMTFDSVNLGELSPPNRGPRNH